MSDTIRMTKAEWLAKGKSLFGCIGRYDGHVEVEMFTKPGPCNYTSGGLLNISPGCAGIFAAARGAALALEGVA